MILVAPLCPNSQYECLELCNLFTQLQFKVGRLETLSVALEGCLVSEQRCTENEYTCGLLEDDAYYAGNDYITYVGMKRRPEYKSLHTYYIGISTQEDSSRVRAGKSE
jgi:hypothetical protein